MNTHKKLIYNAALIPNKCYVYILSDEYDIIEKLLYLIFLIYIDLVFELWTFETI